MKRALRELAITLYAAGPILALAVLAVLAAWWWGS